jgi:hypothetical protein
MQTRKRRGMASCIGAITLASTIGIGLAVMAAPASGAATVARPAVASHGAAGSVKKYSNTLKKNTKGWCTYAEGCNGQVGSDYGTIDVVPQSFSNDGGYAASVAGPGRQKSYARVSGAGTDQDSISGCPSPGSENCTGPYILYGGTGTYAVFPSSGFASSIKIYLDTAWAAANPGQVVDWDVSLNNSSGAFLEDFSFNLCTTADDGGGFYVSDANGAGGCSTGPTEITTSGWYNFEQQFYGIGGQIDVQYLVANSSSQTVFSNLDESGIAQGDAGGPNYGWFPDEDVLGLPVAQVSLTR